MSHCTAKSIYWNTNCLFPVGLKQKKKKKKFLALPDRFDARVVQYAFSKMWDLNNSSSCILFHISHRRSVCKYHRSPAVNCAHLYPSASELSERSYFCQIRVQRLLWHFHICVILHQHTHCRLCQHLLFSPIPEINVIMHFFLSFLSFVTYS